MKDEIKEILEDLRNKNMSVDDLTHNDKTKLLDCITNLQEENKRLNNIIKELEASAREIVRVGKNKGYHYVENIRELKTKDEVYDFIEFYYGLYLLETLNKLKEGKPNE